MIKKISKYKFAVIKVGSNVITRNDGLPDLKIMKSLVGQIAAIMKQGTKVVLVSSGAVAYGRSLVKFSGKADPVAERQQLAAVGQVKLLNSYADIFSKHEINCAQVLVTKDDFRSRKHYLNMKNCMMNLLGNSIIPIVNENDVISITELMFTDNDELSGLIAAMLGADTLLLLTSVDGLYNGKPGNPDAKLIPVVESSFKDFSFISQEKSNFGRGGMITKSRMAYDMAQMGINVHIANGKKDGVLIQVMNGEQVGTRFVASKTASPVKRWIAHSEGFAKGKIVVNAGAVQALLHTEKASSLLPIGIVKIEGHFEKGDTVRIADESGKYLGVGISRYNSEKAQSRIGLKNQPPIIHYDYLFLNA
jgi:glutamate 5-kinase